MIIIILLIFVRCSRSVFNAWRHLNRMHIYITLHNIIIIIVVVRIVIVVINNVIIKHINTIKL